METDTRRVKLNIGAVGPRRHVTDTRGMAFGGAAVLVGTDRNQRAHVYTATTAGVLVPGSIEKIDVKKLAADLGSGVVAVVPNAGRHWTMDEIDMHVGEVVDFQGVKMCWAGDMSADEIKVHFGAPYVIGKILRNTDWIYKAGKPVYLLRDPSGITWVNQEYTKEVDPSLTIDNLDQLGGKLKTAGGLEVRDQGAHQGPVARHASQRPLGLDHARRAGQHLRGHWLRRHRELRAVARSEPVVVEAGRGLESGARPRSPRLREEAPVRATGLENHS